MATSTGATRLRLGRRTALLGAASAGLVPATAILTAAPLARARPAVSGVRSGEVTTSSAVLWARAPGPGTLRVELRSGRRHWRTARGGLASPRTDLTARAHLTGLAPGREYEATLRFDGVDGGESAPQTLRFRTAPVHAAAQSFCWSADTCGQGFGIDRSRGGLSTYGAIHATRPDFFVHCGDTVYADEPMAESRDLPDGTTWRNDDLTEDVAVVAQTLRQFRGRHRYVLRDDNVQALYAEVPTIAQWDDHETANNWYPGETLDTNAYGDRYTETRADVLAARGRRAWQEYQPVPVRRLAPAAVGPAGSAGTDVGFAPDRIYRRVPRGQHLDLFCLDMRSYRGPNPSAQPGHLGSHEEGILGPTQARWLVDGLRRSTATWKVVCADLPLSIPSSHLDDLDGPSNADGGPPLGREPEIARVLAALKRHRVRNVVWITADVHYTAAHRYDPANATFTDFDPFWEFVSGPVASQPFAVKDELDGTFGPEVVFSKGDTSGLGLREVAPRPDNQFFGHVAIDADGRFTVTLHDGTGAALWRRTLDPDDPPRLPA